MTPRRAALEAAFVVAIVWLFHHPLWRFDRLLSGGDAANLFWPIKTLLQRAWLDHGVVPLWNPYSFMGAPLLASLQHAVLYPPDWFVYTLAPAHAGIHLGNLIHLALAAVGAWAWLRIGLGRGPAPGVVLAAALPATAWFWGHHEHINQIAAIGWMPLQAFVMWMYVRGRMGARPFVLVYTSISALAFLAGHPQEAFYGQLFAGFLVLGKLLFGWRDDPRPRSLILPLAGAALLSGLLVAAQLLPSLEASSHSRRQFRDPGYALTFSMPPDLLVTYFSPHAFGNFRDGFWNPDATGNLLPDRRAYGEYGLYVGVPVLLLAVAGFFAGRTERRFVTMMAVVVALSLALALGGNLSIPRLVSGDFTEFPPPAESLAGLSLYEVFLRLFPVADGFRVPARISILATFALLTMASFGWDRLTGLLAEGRSRQAAHGAIGVAVLLALYLPSRAEKFHHPAPVRPILPAAVADVGENRYDHRHYRLTVSDDARLVAERHLGSTYAAGNPLPARMIALQPHMNVVGRNALVDGYEEGLVPTARFKDFLYEFNRNFRQFEPDAALLMLLGVRFVYTDTRVNAEAFPIAFADDPTWLTHRNRAWRGVAFPARAAQGQDLSRLDGPWWRGAGPPHPEIQRTAVPIGTVEPTEQPPAWRTTVPTPNSIRVAPADLPDPVHREDALLALGWYPGWVFEPSGAPVEWLNAVNARLPVAEQHPDGGWHLAFKPSSYRVGLFLTALGLGLWAALAGAMAAGGVSTSSRPSA